MIIPLSSVNPRLMLRLVYLLLGLGCLSLFSIEIVRNYPDIPLHNLVAEEIYSGKRALPFYFLYFVLIMLPLFLVKSLWAVHVFSVLVLTFAVLWKFRITKRIFAEECGTSLLKRNDFQRVSICVATALLLLQNLVYRPSSTMFLGYLPVNTWHNSTTIFLMPFALLLFYASHRYLLSPQPALLRNIIILMVLNIVIKPSYFMVFVMVFPLFALIRFRLSKAFFLSLIIPVVGGAAIILQSRLAFYSGGEHAPLKIIPFHVWSHWSQNIPLAFLSSEAFPLAFLVLYFKEIQRSLLLSYAYVTFAIGLLVFIFITESGYKQFDGNFSWQVIVCNYILFLAVSISFFKMLFLKTDRDKKDSLLLIIFVLHILTGCLYLLKSPFLNFG